MEDKRLLFLSIKGVKDAALTVEQINESGRIISWLNSMVNPNYQLITSPLQECLAMAQLIFSKLSIPFKVSENLLCNKNLQYAARNQIESFEMISIPDFQNLGDVQGLIDVISNQFNYLIFVLESEEFESLHIKCKLREEATMALHIYEIDKPSVASNESSQIKKSVDFAFLTKTFKSVSNSFPEVRDNIESLQVQISKVPRQASAVAKNLKKPFYSQQIAFTDKLNDLSLSIESIVSSLQATTNTIMNLKSLSDLYISSEVSEGFLLIKRFLFQPFSNSWNISIKNPTPCDFRKVDIYIAETNSIICSFHIIQRLSTVSKTISLLDSQYYGRNLVAVSRNQAVSEAMTICPYLISISKMQSTQGKVHIQLKNYSPDITKDIIFVANTSVNPLHVHKSPLGYGETMLFDIPRRLIENAEVFAVESNIKVSNSLLIR